MLLVLIISALKKRLSEDKEREWEGRDERSD